MLDKRNRMKWRKLMHHTYTFTPTSSHQSVHPVYKVIVEPRLCFSSWLVHLRLSYVWQNILEYCNFCSDGSLFAQMSYPCSFYLRVVLDMLYSPPNSLKIGSHVQLYSHFFHFSMTDIFMVSKFFTKIPFYSLPLFVWTGGVSK